MMVKPEGADEGEAKPLEPPPVNTADDPEGEDAEAMDALLGVGSDLSGAAPAAPHRNGDTRADAAPPRALERVKSQEKNAPSRARLPQRDPRPGARAPPPLSSSARPQPPSGYPPPSRPLGSHVSRRSWHPPFVHLRSSHPPLFPSLHPATPGPNPERSHP